MIIIQKPDGSYQHNDYNASNELIKISVYNKLDQLLYESVYNYDDRGNLISENELTTLLSRTSTYDQSNQLVAHASMLDQTPLNNYNFSYDDAGNILSLQKNDLSNSFLYTSSNRIMSVNGQSAEYDNDGNLTMITLDGVTKNYQYDSRNRLISDSILLYGYDSENKRVSKTNGTDITNYTINVNGRLSEVLVKTVNGESTYFVYGIGLISQEKGSDYSVYHYDYRGNTVLITDKSGQVTDSFIYGPYGTIEDRTGNSDIDFLFSGQLGIETDENGLVYLNDRYYDPSVGRFLNEDPYSLKSQDILNLNLYSFCANDPLNNVDPTGNYIETIIDIVSVISSAVEFYKNPTIFSFSFLVADTVAALLPGAVAPSAVSKGIRWGDEAVLAFKGGSDGKYLVGAYQDIKGVPGLDAHHAGQKSLMKDLVENYDPKTAPAINVPKVGHTISGPNGIVSRSTSGIDSARQLLARDIMELRRVYDDIPNSALKELIELNKKMFPEMRVK